MEKIEFENQLLDAMKNDDLKSFSFLMPTNADLNLCFGRFPILSILYMYSSFNILAKYEKALMPIHNFRIVEERIGLYKLFKSRAGKSLRLFQGDEIIYPIQMLAVLDERIIIDNNYKFLYKNAEIIDKFRNIYNLRHELKVQTEEKVVSFPLKKLKTRHYFISGLLASICCFIIGLSSIMLGFVSNTIGIGTPQNPIKVSSASEFALVFDKGGRNYVLTSDLTISCDENSADIFSGVLDGRGYTLTIEGDVKNPFVKNLTGTIKNLKIKFTNNEIKLTQNSAIISQNNKGIIENCEITGDFVMKFDSTDEVFAGLFASSNYGKISNCIADVSGTMSNVQESNAYFGMFAGLNEKGGQILDCNTKEGVLIADTVDIAGIVGQNNGVIKNVSNKVHLSQTSSKQWHPNVAGIAVANYGTIETSSNLADLSSKSEVNVVEEKDAVYYVFVGGISCENYGSILSCKNKGKVVGTGDISYVLAGGICAQNIKNTDHEGVVRLSLNDSYIKGFSQQAQVCVGGVVGMNSSVVINSGSKGTIEADSNSTSNEPRFMNKVDKNVAVVSGGVVGVNQNALVQNSYSDMLFVCGADVEGTLKIYSGVIGSIGMFKYTYLNYPEIGYYYPDAYRYVGNNYYVSKDVIKQGAYGVNGVLEQRNGGLYYNSGVAEVIPETGNEAMIKKCASFDEIPAEVKIDE